MYQTGCSSECPERKSSENKVIHAKKRGRRSRICFEKGKAYIFL